MEQVVITGIGLICALGESLDVSWQRLIAGESSIELVQPFLNLKPRPLALIDRVPISLATLSQQIVAAAIADAGLVPPLPDFGVAIASSRAHQASWERFCQSGLLDPRDWLESLPHQVAIAAARQIGATGPVLVPMAACATGLWAIARGCLSVEMGECERAIAGAVEAPITPLTLAGFEKMGALAKTGCYPFDRQREGLVLGEGGAVFVLESLGSARRRNARIYGRVLGFGLTADGYRMSAPEPRGKGAIAAIQQCLNRSHLSTDDIDYIHAHGTSTKINDEWEAKVIQTLFPRGVAVSSTKGATGHTLGASGALGVAFSLMALNDRILPPCVGLKESEFNLDVVMPARFCRGGFETRPPRRVLCLSFGFGGQNGAIALSL